MLRAHSIIALQGFNSVSRGPRAGAWALHSVQSRQEEGVGCWDVTFSHGTLMTQNGAVCWLIFPHGCEEPMSDPGCSRMDYLGSVAELLNLAVSLPVV